MEKKWVCKDWYFDLEQSHVSSSRVKPEDCYFKQQYPSDQRRHTARCGWYYVDFIRIEELN